MNLLKTLIKTAGIFENKKIPYAFIGGVAVSYYVIPRATYDIDALILIKDMSELDMALKKLRKIGFKVQGGGMKKISGFSFMCLMKDNLYIDIFIAEGEYLLNAVKRRRKIKIDRRSVYLISREDLIILKLISGRGRDLDDVRSLLQTRKLNYKYLEEWSGRMGVKTFLDDEIASLKIIKNRHRGKK
ncbi:MAG: DUF6036 family nucleotidyltransferase [Elusimicrobiota bacterium]|nr:DUF6036 family nucleotidyltransferase [Elusimicrobiota bacterium]